MALQGEVAVGMDVDEPWRNHKSGHVDDPRSGDPYCSPDIGDLAVVHRHVRRPGPATGAINKEPASQDEGCRLEGRHGSGSLSG